MAESSYPWNASPLVGDASLSPYDAENVFADWVNALAGGWSWAALYESGIFLSEDDLLAPFAGANQITFGLGRAVVHGTLYKNTGAVIVAIPTPVSSTRTDLIVLRKDWSLKTVRITRIAGSEGGVAPDPVNINGSIWDMELATVAITTAGGITLTDRRYSAAHTSLLMTPNPPVAIVNNLFAATLNVPTATFTQILFNTDRYKNIEGMHSIASNTSRVIALHPGIYEITAEFDWATQTGGNVRAIYIYKNGVAITNSMGYFFVTPTAAGLPSTKCRLPPFKERLNALDYIEMYVYQDSGSTIACANRGSAMLQMALVAP